MGSIVVVDSWWKVCYTVGTSFGCLGWQVSDVSDLLVW